MREGGQKGNMKYGPVKCDDCGHRADGFDFKRIFSKKLRCPNCKSFNISNVERPKVIPAPQTRR
jgi:predicted Zn-ribbon and HTH transcriptional regulator